MKFWIPPVLWMGVIFYISSLPGSDIPKCDIPFADKIAHCAEFFILGALAIRAFLRSSPGIPILKALAISLLMTSVYAAFDEWHQIFILDRTADILDFAADFLGLNIGILIYLIAERKI